MRKVSHLTMYSPFEVITNAIIMIKNCPTQISHALPFAKLSVGNGK
jgi:hypothetical protein